MTPQPADPLDFTAQYNTPLPAEKQAAYESWSRSQGQDPVRGKYDYDLQGAFLANSGSGDRGHFSDQFKKRNHPTFSDESQYHGIDGYVGGKWTDAGYQPSKTNLTFRTPTQLKDYFSKTEPGTALLPPAPVPQPTGPGGVYRIQDFKAGAPTYTPRPQRFFGGPGAQ